MKNSFYSVEWLTRRISVKGFANNHDLGEFDYCIVWDTRSVVQFGIPQQVRCTVWDTLAGPLYSLRYLSGSVV